MDLDKVIAELRKRRDTAARNVVLFTSDTGTAVQMGQAIAFNDALKLLGVDDASDPEIIALQREDIKRVRGY